MIIFLKNKCVTDGAYKNGNNISTCFLTNGEYNKNNIEKCMGKFDTDITNFDKKDLENIINFLNETLDKDYFNFLNSLKDKKQFINSYINLSKYYYNYKKNIEDFMIIFHKQNFNNFISNKKVIINKNTLEEIMLILKENLTKKDFLNSLKDKTEFIDRYFNFLKIYYDNIEDFISIFDDTSIAKLIKKKDLKFTDEILKENLTKKDFLNSLKDKKKFINSYFNFSKIYYDNIEDFLNIFNNKDFYNIFFKYINNQRYLKFQETKQIFEKDLKEIINQENLNKNQKISEIITYFKKNILNEQQFYYTEKENEIKKLTETNPINLKKLLVFFKFSELEQILKPINIEAKSNNNQAVSHIVFIIITFITISFIVFKLIFNKYQKKIMTKKIVIYSSFLLTIIFFALIIKFNRYK